MSERKTHKLFRFIKPFLHVRYFGLLATSGEQYMNKYIVRFGEDTVEFDRSPLNANGKERILWTKKDGNKQSFDTIDAACKKILASIGALGT